MMRRSVALLILAVLMLPACSHATTSIFSDDRTTQLATHDIWVEALSATTFHIDCIEGQLLEGHFLIIIDSELFPGDQQKYDIYPSLTGIDFLIFNETNYALWLDGSVVTPQFERTDINELSWNIEISHSGRWYIVYSNNGIARKRIQGSFQIVGSVNPLEIGLILGVISIVVLVGVLYRQRYRFSQ